jgi:hypothetical protein
VVGSRIISVKKLHHLDSIARVARFLEPLSPTSRRNVATYRQTLDVPSKGGGRIIYENFGSRKFKNKASNKRLHNLLHTCI